MLVVMQSHATDAQVRAVCERIESLGYKALPVPGAGRTAVCITGNTGAVDIGSLESMPGVIECIPVSKPYKLVSRDVKEETTVVQIRTPLGDVSFGGSAVGMVAGPCAIETQQQAFAVAERIKKAGARLFRGGAYKPRTSPYSFQGLGGEICGRDSNRRAQHAEFFALEARGKIPKTHPAEARDVRNAR